jgi:hypothetical protein
MPIEDLKLNDSVKPKPKMCPLSYAAVPLMQQGPLPASPPVMVRPPGPLACVGPECMCFWFCTGSWVQKAEDSATL